MDFLEKCALERTRKIKRQKPKVGHFAQLSSEYGDVWHEIESVHGDFMMIYAHRRNERPIELKFFSYLRTTSKTLPKDARCVYVKEGAFTERTGNLNELPKRLKIK